MAGLDLDRLRRGDYTVAFGACALLVFMFFFDWFALDLSSLGKASVLIGAFLNAKEVSTSVNAWHSLEVTRWAMLLTVLAAVALVALDGIGRGKQVRLPPSVAVMGLGALSTVLVAYRVFFSHPFAHASVRPAAYLGLAACVLIAYGGYLALTDERALATDLAGVPQRAT